MKIIWWKASRPALIWLQSLFRALWLGRSQRSRLSDALGGKGLSDQRKIWQKPLSTQHLLTQDQSLDRCEGTGVYPVTVSGAWKLDFRRVTLRQQTPLIATTSPRRKESRGCRNSPLQLYVVERRKSAFGLLISTVCLLVVVFIAWWFFCKSWKHGFNSRQNQAIKKLPKSWGYCLKPSSLKECSIF